MSHRPAIPGMHQLLPGNLQPGAHLHWQQACVSGRMLLSRRWPNYFEKICKKNCWFSLIGFRRVADALLACCSVQVRSLWMEPVWLPLTVLVSTAAPCTNLGKRCRRSVTTGEQRVQWSLILPPKATLQLLVIYLILMNLISVPLSSYSTDKPNLPLLTVSAPVLVECGTALTTTAQVCTALAKSDKLHDIVVISTTMFQSVLVAALFSEL